MHHGAAIKSLPYALVAGRQTSCNEKWPIHLYDSWPLGASAADATGAWHWALGAAGGALTPRAENLAQFTGTAACGDGPAGGVVDMTGTLDPAHPSVPRTAYFAFETQLAQNGELAYNSTAEVRAYHGSPERSKSLRHNGFDDSGITRGGFPVRILSMVPGAAAALTNGGHVSRKEQAR